MVYQTNFGQWKSYANYSLKFLGWHNGMFTLEDKALKKADVVEGQA
jgi:hypothetical protein